MTWPLLDSSTHVLVQGMLGKEGSRMARWMMASGTNVVAGISPGQGGQSAEGCMVFGTVREAHAQFPEARTSCVVVPGAHVLAAVKEGIEAGVTFFQIITERVPVHDVLALRVLASTHGAVILGPSSVGYLQFPKFRLGYLGGEDPFSVIREGGLAVLSASGGMANETLVALAHQNTGVRMAMAVGGDAVAGFSLTDAVQMADARPDVSVIAVFVEPGNPLLRGLIGGTVKPSKPLALCLPGDALELFPRGLPYGHAGTVLGEDDPPLADVRRNLTQAGYYCTARHDEFIAQCAQL